MLRIFQQAPEARVLLPPVVDVAALAPQTVESEFCFYIDFDAGSSLATLSDEQRRALLWVISETFETAKTGFETYLRVPSGPERLVELGPRLAFASPFSTNACSIFRNIGLPVRRVERYRRHLLSFAAGSPAADVDAAAAGFAAAAHDRMTEAALAAPLVTFESGVAPAPVTTIPVLERGRAALEAVNASMGLSWDDFDLDYYHRLFAEDLKRNPTDVELFDISQSNSEHSRHWFFKAQLTVDGVAAPRTLMELVQDTLAPRAGNSVVAFADNSSAIAGFETRVVAAAHPGAPGELAVAAAHRHCLLTAETHNFPTGVAPFPGAETGTGGRIRDTHATGRGSHVIAGTAGYAVGNLHISGYPLPWEAATAAEAAGGRPGGGYPSTLAGPLAIEIGASNGASDYGNKFGEPVVAGFTRSAGLWLPVAAAAADGASTAEEERREYIKPIMFSGGIGALDAGLAAKEPPAAGMLVVKLGGPAYRIGMGGSAASSMLQGANRPELDFNAVQRGDAEMEQKVNRVIRACCELGAANPILSIHDQGAGGNCNVLKEIVAPAGGRIDIRAVPVGDATLSVLEIWGAEYQENDALLVRPASRGLLEAICARERAPVAFVGEVTGDGHVRVVDAADGSTPVDMDVAKVLGDMPQKAYASARRAAGAPLALPAGLTPAAALDRVLRLLSVGSKRFLTNKVDRSVTGLVAQQQCVGPLHTPLSDCAVVALSHVDTVGVASSIGEAPLKGLVNPAAMARMAVGEAITNLFPAAVAPGPGMGGLAGVKCSANWMWAAKLPHEAAAMYDACVAMSQMMLAVGVAVDGGKDSLSMAAKHDGALVKSPGTLVVSLYAACPDITVTRTPDAKCPKGGSSLLLLDLSSAAAAPPRARLGGSALAQVFGQVGAPEQVPDCDAPEHLVAAFAAVQAMLRRPAPGGGGGGSSNSSSSSGLLSVHDRSDGGLLVAALEMAFAGNCGLHLDLGPLLAALGPGVAPLEALFAEELGVLLEVDDAALPAVAAALAAAGVRTLPIGRPVPGADVVRVADGAGVLLLDAPMTALRDAWEATSFQLERLQANRACVAQEEAGMRTRTAPPFRLTFDPSAAAPLSVPRDPGASWPAVAVLREEGSNGDREMGAALLAAGFRVLDVHMADLVAGTFALRDGLRGLVFPGGFSYADVLGSAKGWAAVIRFRAELAAQFTAFHARADTFSLGVCNGCQLSALLGWVPFGPPGSAGAAAAGVSDATQPRFVHNASGRFESRFVAVRVEPSPAVLLRGMAGSVLGVWSAHGEGRAHFPDAAALAAVRAGGLVPLSYVDDAGAATEAYPFNPNGSPHGIAGLCTADGRHLAVMPHPERAALLWQWPWMPAEWRATLTASPWARMFANAFEWCAADGCAPA